MSKLYYLAWNEAAWAAYQSVFKKLVFTVDGVERQATPWPDWALTTVIDTRAWWPAVWRAVGCHESQVGAYAALRNLSTVAVRGVLGIAIVLSRVQPRQRRARASKRICSKAFDDHSN